MGNVERWQAGSVRVGTHARETGRAHVPDTRDVKRFHFLAAAFFLPPFFLGASSSGAAFFDFFAIAGAGARMCRHVPAHLWLIP